MSLLLTLSRFHTLFWCLLCGLWTSKYRLGSTFHMHYTFNIWSLTSTFKFVSFIRYSKHWKRKRTLRLRKKCLEKPFHVKLAVNLCNNNVLVNRNKPSQNITKLRKFTLRDGKGSKIPKETFISNLLTETFKMFRHLKSTVTFYLIQNSMRMLCHHYCWISFHAWWENVRCFPPYEIIHLVRSQYFPRN